MEKRSSRFALVVGLGLILLSLIGGDIGCRTRETKQFRPGTKAELLRLMDAKYRGIKRLNCNLRLVITHDGNVNSSEVWASPPFSIKNSNDGVYLDTSTTSYSKSTRFAGLHRDIDEIMVRLITSSNGEKRKKRPIDLLAMAQTSASKKYLIYRGIKRAGSSYVLVLKGKPKEELGVKEIWLDSGTLLPVRIVSEGEDQSDEILTVSDYLIDPKIPRSRFKIGFPPKSQKLAEYFAKLNGVANDAIEDNRLDDFPFDLYFPSKIPKGYQLLQLQVMRTEVSGTIENYSYELPLLSYEFQNKEMGKKIDLGIRLSSNEKAFKANLVSNSGEGVNLSSSMKDIIASLDHWGTLKETNLSQGRLYYWLSNGKVASGIIKMGKNWLEISPVYGEEVEEEFFLTVVDSLEK